MTTDKWDGKTRKMLVWFDNCLKIYKEYIVGYSRKGGWVNSDGDKYPHCADIPYYESNEKFSIDYIIKTISERTQDEYWIPFDNCIVEYLKELKELKVENGKLKNGVKELKNSSSYLVYGEMCNEQNKLKEQVKSLRDDRFKMASEVSSAVWKEVTYDLNTTIKYEASTFDKIEELREKKPHKINDSWVGECLSNTCVDEDACNEPIIKD